MAASTSLATLPGRLVERMTARRGRAHAFPRLAPPATALVVIDMTHIFISERPETEAITAVINRVGRSLRSGGGSVLWVQPGPFEHPDLLGAVIGQEAAALQQSAAAGLSPDGRLWPALDVQPGDLLARKSLYSAFFPAPATFQRS